jgi:hypothetical protein
LLSLFEQSTGLRLVRAGRNLKPHTNRDFCAEFKTGSRWLSIVTSPFAVARAETS